MTKSVTTLKAHPLIKLHFIIISVSGKSNRRNSSSLLPLGELINVSPRQTQAAFLGYPSPLPCSILSPYIVPPCQSVRAYLRRRHNHIFSKRLVSIFYSNGGSTIIKAYPLFCMTGLWFWLRLQLSQKQTLPHILWFQVHPLYCSS